ncbi:MAG: DUF6790 family protein [Solirubrobacterales bacterium]
MSERAMRIGLIFFGGLNVLTGLLFLFAPDYFFDHIGPYGVQNNHYLGDVGAFYLAAGIGLLIAVQRPSWRVPLLVVVAIWYGLHAINHLFDIGDNNRSDLRGIGDTVLIAIGAAALAYMARAASRIAGQPPPPPTPRARPRDYPPGD